MGLRNLASLNSMNAMNSLSTMNALNNLANQGNSLSGFLNMAPNHQNLIQHLGSNLFSHSNKG